MNCEENTWVVKKIEKEELDKIFDEYSLSGISDEEKARCGNNDEVVFVEEENEEKFFPDYIKKGNLMGTDPETGKRIIKTENNEKVYVKDENVLPVSAFKKAISATRGNALLQVFLGLEKIIKNNKSICKIFFLIEMASAVLGWYCLIKKYMIFSFLCLLLILFSGTITISCYKMIDIIKSQKNHIGTKILTYVLFLYAARKIGIDFYSEKENRCGLLEEMAEEFVAKGEEYAKTLSETDFEKYIIKIVP